MRELGISRVFDLRSTTEMEKYNTPVPHIEDVQVLSVPVFEKEDYSPEVMARWAELLKIIKIRIPFVYLITNVHGHIIQEIPALCKWKDRGI